MLPRRKLFYEELNNDTPSPDKQNAHLKPQKIHNVKIGKELKMNERPDNRNVPGPGEYDSHEYNNVEKNTQPRPVFGKAGIKTGRADMSSADKTVPGPGNYPQKTTVGEGPNFSMSARMHDIKAKRDAKCPGPNHYKPTKSFTSNHNPTWRFGSDPKKASYINRSVALENPGPGNYDHSLNRLKGKTFGGASFGKSNRFPRIRDMPGPGEYTLNRDISEW